MKPLRGTDVKRLNREWRRRTSGGLALLLDGVQNPFNVGTIVRTAAAFRVDHLWLAANATPPTHPKVGKTALGTERLLAWSAHDTVADAAALAREAGYHVIGVELADGAVAVHDAPLPEAVCFALGHEDRGLSAACLEVCDAVVYVPQPGRVGSLNVAQAATVVLWEARRRGWGA